eukprot:TRINITY_DN7220_c0_g1_i1.p1 TRINITY_DN7220_c0_g1~~TRINITY_DN7220_c0_g1_i1.p1  ORF type:complete len:311 (+),score=76.77 TRINITY_DN7220_c0_g1_i1:56-934(+)
MEKMAKNPRDASSAKDWAHSVYHVQTASMSPEMRAQLQHRCEQQRRARMQHKSCSSMRIHKQAVESHYYTGLRMMRSAPTPRRISEISAEVQRQIESVPAPESGIVGLPVPPVPATDIDELLSELRHEPVDDEARSAKFSLYERFSEKVDGVRRGLLEFWQANRASFTGNVLIGVERAIRNIDSEQNMSISDLENVWFVYLMVKQAAANSGRMEAVLADLERKLDLLANLEQPDCPICLESFDGDAAAAEVLACCHKVCGTCWQRWQQVAGPRAFCPICKHEEFITELAGLQ